MSNSDDQQGIHRVIFGPGHAQLIHRMAAIPATAKYGLRRFPTPAEYHRHVSQWGEQRPTLSLDDVYASAQREWHVRGQTGCQFARLAARAADTLRWDYLVLSDAEPSPDTLAALDTQLQLAAADPAVEIVSVLAPAIASLSGAAALLTGLTGPHTLFWLELDQIVNGSRRMHLRYPVAPAVRAWVMAFAPWPEVPNTRRGPYLELAIRVKPKPASIFHRLTPDRDVAHLADIPMQMNTKHWEDRWLSTMARTRMILGKDPDDVAAAKVTLTVPA